MKRICRDVIVFSLFAFIPVAASGQLLRTVAISDDAAPGTLTGVSYSSFNSPALNAVGQVAYSARLSGPDVDSTNIEGIWSEGSGILDLVARQGEPAPGVPGQLTLGSFSGTPLLNAAGQTAFIGFFGPGIAPGLPPDTFPIPQFRSGIWMENSAGLELVARSGEPALGAADGTKFLSVGGPLINDTGQIAFASQTLNGNFRGGERATGIFLGTRESLMTALYNAGNSLIALTPEGEVTTYDTVAQRVLTGTPGALQVVVQKGDPAPTGGTFRRVGSTPISNVNISHAAGHTAFLAEAEGNGGFGLLRGVWKEHAGVFTPIAQEDDPAPGTPGITFHDFLDTVINSSGESVFHARYTDTPGSFLYDGQGIWSDSGGSLALVALEGDPAPGAPGMFFGDDLGNSSQFVFSTPAINAAGQVAFFASLDGLAQRGIWAEDLDGTLQLIAKSGDQLLVGPSDSRTVEFLNFAGGSGSEAGQSNGFNNLGQVAFSARFTDGSSGVFVSNLVAVPEPSTSLLLLTSILLFIPTARNRKMKLVFDFLD